MEDITGEPDPSDSPYQDALATLCQGLATIMRNIRNKNGSTADFTRALHMQIELLKLLDSRTPARVEVSWVESDSWSDPE